MRTEITPGQDSDYTGYDLVMADNLPQPAVLGNHPAWAAGGRSQVAGLDALGLLGRGAQFCAS